MKAIELEFQGRGDVRGIKFTQIKREGLVVLYERSDGYFEVIKLREQKASTQTIGGARVHFEEKEIYPSGESWNGKCVKRLDTANLHFKRMIDGEVNFDYKKF